MTCSFSKDFSYTGITSIENAFIYEYLPLSKGDTARVYLYGLFLCQNPSFNQGLKEIAETLKMTEDEVLECFSFWEEFGLVSIISKDPLSVTYLPVKNAGYSKPVKYKTEKYTEFTKGLQALIPSRMISTGEYTGYFSIMETYGIKPEAMLMIVKYCADKKGNDIGFQYISKVAKDFGAKGITTVEKVENELSSYVLRTGEIEKILSALSLKRKPDIEDQNLYRKWTQELSFETQNIVFAASKMKKGSMAKLDQFLMELYSTKSFDKSEISDYMNKKQEIFELAVKINKALSIYVEVLDTEIDTYINKWLSYGFDDQALLSIASKLFKDGKNTLSDMDELVENLRNKGAVSLSSVLDAFNEEIKDDEFIKKFLLITGINRRPTPWDRENLKVWKSWNFTEEMIIEAAKLSAGKSSPIAYMNGVLSNWKTNDVYELNAISSEKNKDNSQEEYNAEYERRRSVAASRAQRNLENALNVDGFNEIYSRLFGIEKDLAFAEINGNNNATEKLEEEKKTLTDKANGLLKKLNIDLSDLTPKYACEKCNDTGYVGTHRCDCFDKKVN